MRRGCVYLDFCHGERECVSAWALPHKHCWQLSIVIKSGVMLPGLNQLWSSDKLKVVWDSVSVRTPSHNEGTGVCVFVRRHHCYSWVNRVPFTVRARDCGLTSPTADCLMCWYRQNVFLKCFLEEKKPPGQVVELSLFPTLHPGHRCIALVLWKKKKTPIIRNEIAESKHISNSVSLSNYC